MVLVLFLFLLILGYALRDNMNSHLSKMMKTQITPEDKASGVAIMDSLYNYSKNGLPYEITFLEFGSTGCSACKRMEKVMEEIQDQYPNKVNVIFINVTKKENYNLLLFYGIAVIPTQVLLDKTGQEIFRHSGFIPTEEISKHINHY